MSVLELTWNWNATLGEWQAAYPCDKFVQEPYRVLMRAIDVEAPASVLYRWICQIKIAPYSYDLLDNRGRRSPRQLTPGAEKLAPGQLLMGVFSIVEFEKDRHMTAVAEAGRLYGTVALTYAAVPTGPVSSRLVVRIDGECHTRRDLMLLYPIAWGDLIMMRKQLRVLKKLAEKTAREGAITAGLPVGM